MEFWIKIEELNYNFKYKTTLCIEETRGEQEFLLKHWQNNFISDKDIFKNSQQVL